MANNIDTELTLEVLVEDAAQAYKGEKNSQVVLTLELFQYIEINEKVWQNLSLCGPRLQTTVQIGGSSGVRQ